MKYVEKCIIAHSVGENKESRELIIEIDGISMESESLLNWEKERIEAQMEREAARTLTTE